MAKRSALTKNPSATPVGRDVVYTGGSKDFDEVTGKYRSSGRATPAPTRLSPGVYRDSQGRLVGQGGRPLPQQPQRPPMQQQPPRPIEWSPQQPGQQGKGPARDVYTPLPQPPMGLKPQQPDYTGGTGDYNRMPFTLGNEVDRELSFDMGLEDSTRRYGMGGGEYGVMPNIPSMPGNANQVMLDRENARAGGAGNDLGFNNMGRGANPTRPGMGAYAMQPDTMYLGGSADFDESTGRYRSGYVPPDRGMGGGMGRDIGMVKQPLNNMGGVVGNGLGNLVAGGVRGGMGMVKQPLNNMGGGMNTGVPSSPGMVDPRTMVGPQYDPLSIAFPVNNYSDRGNNSMRDSIARRALMLRDQNAANKMRQDLGNFNMQDMVPYNANRRR